MLDRSSPPDARRLQMRALILNRTGDPKALEALGAAAALLSSARGEGTDALLMQVHLDRAGLLTLLRREKEAQDEMDRAVDVAPPGEVGALERGRLRYNSYDLGGADADFGLALERLADDDDTRSVQARARVARRGRAHGRPGRRRAGLPRPGVGTRSGERLRSGPRGRSAWPRAGSTRPRTCSSALEGSPETWVYIELGELYRRLGRFEEALERLEFALGLDPDDAYARARGQVQRASGRYDEAIDDLLAAIAAVPFPWAIEELLLAVSAWPDSTRLQDVLVALDSISAAGKEPAPSSSPVPRCCGCSAVARRR